MLDLPRGPAASHAFAQAERGFGRIEAALSRFRDDSELSRLNRRRQDRPGEARLARPPPSCRLRPERRQEGASTHRPRRRSWRRATTVRSSSWPAEGRAAEARRLRRAVASTATDDRAGARLRLDLGGIGKGYAVDRVAERSPPRPVPRQRRGDVAVRGQLWPVGVETRRVPHARAHRARWRRRAATAGLAAGTARSSTA